ncbi:MULTISPECIES: acyl carrier protein [unclassified Streptomyces]|jgi:acyl carrier protein|uniref:acyl carrier protein n=1 Tax=unclassified Streptomyces TaxID=2593676 RepID=UPI001CBDA370|nr:MULTISPECIES: acyl carrier protein [unclassified Streptomyces]WPO73327.1 acyl carrier protein [Streptomyces sp. KN37]
MTTQTQPLSDQLLDLLAAGYEAPEGTTSDTRFDLLGFDSLVLVEVAVDLTRRYGVQVTDEELQEAGTVAGTVELLRSKGVDA